MHGRTDIPSLLLKKDEKKINRLELLEDEESYENEDYYQLNNLSDETDCDENIDNDHTIFPMWDPHNV